MKKSADGRSESNLRQAHFIWRNRIRVSLKFYPPVFSSIVRYYGCHCCRKSGAPRRKHFRLVRLNRKKSKILCVILLVHNISLSLFPAWWFIGKEIVTRITGTEIEKLECFSISFLGGSIANWKRTSQNTELIHSQDSDGIPCFETPFVDCFFVCYSKLQDQECWNLCPLAMLYQALSSKK